ncbi:MAG: T9SS type A sorting domain-containing protein [Cyclobacteriaceae bacterium]
MKTTFLFISVCFLSLTNANAQFNVGDSFNDGSLSNKVKNSSPLETIVTERPLIWVKESEKQDILDEINNNPWKKTYYAEFSNRVNAELSTYMSNRQAYLSQLPFDSSNVVAGQIPPLKTLRNSQANAYEDQVKYKHFLQSGIDSGVLYFLTGNEDYAKYSASIFYTFMKGMNQVPLASSSSSINTGWIYPTDHLKESREIGAQIPVLYDFIATYIKNGGMAYDFAANIETTIDWLEAEQIFRNYIFLAKERGGIASNWPALESPSLVSNTLALDNQAERDAELLYAIDKRATRQIPLSVMSQKIQDNNGIWPEPFTYAKYVAEFSTYLMGVITKYDPSYNLAYKYANIPQSLDIPNDFSWPNGNRTIHFGDGSRSFQRYHDGYELAYYLGKLTNNGQLLDKFGKLINSSIDYGNYQRQALSNNRSTAIEPYYDEPLRLLWYSGEVNGASADFKQNVTNELSFAGISLQRNIDTPDPVLNGLMLFVGGAGFVHSYASGMNMELYGPKTVIGAAAGNTKKYTSTIHRNYYRLFAAHNTVIVNGASQGSGGIADINIKRVEKLSIEPEYTELPVSPKNSFSTTRFSDDKGDQAEAVQNRTMAIVRTSPTSGYYVDVFKSNSSLANEYHDYVYHNLSDSLVLESNGSNLPLTSDPNRYSNGDTSGGFNNPGWQYFSDIQTSGFYSGDVTATFTATRLGDQINMKMHIPNEANREYTRVSAPPTLGVSSSYDNTPTPTILIRHNGEAWDTPFTAVYEPYIGTNTNTVTKVTNIKRNGIFTGLEVASVVDGKNIKQIILIKDTDNTEFNDTVLDVELTGRFAVLSLDENNKLTSIYMGKGFHIKYKGWDITSTSRYPTSFYVDIIGNNAEIKTNSELTISYPQNITVSDNDLITIIPTTIALSNESNDLASVSPNFVFYKNNNSSIWDLKTNNVDLSNVHLRIVNLLGITVMKKKINSPLTQIDLSHVLDGVYIVLLTNDNFSIKSKKVIITN